MTSESKTSESMILLPPLASGCYPGHWAGRFIWDNPHNKLPVHRYIMFRKTLDVKECGNAARIHITAVYKYKLWINGEYIGRGPVPSYCSEWKSYDTHDLTGKLRPGKNVIAVLVWFTANPGIHECDQKPGLWAQMEYIDSEGCVRTIGSDDSWRMRYAQNYRRDVGFAAPSMSTEFYEDGKDPVDWNELDFNDSSWETPTVFSNTGVLSYNVSTCSYLEPRMMPLLREREVSPLAIACSGEALALPCFRDITVGLRIGTQIHSPLKHARAENIESLVGDGIGNAIFQNNSVARQVTAGKNLLSKNKCSIFVTDKHSPSLPSIKQLASIPEQLHVGDTDWEREDLSLNATGEINLSPFTITEGDTLNRTAYVCIPFTVKDAGVYKFGAGADWWMQCFIDEALIMDTIAKGDGFQPPCYENRIKDVSLSAGDHLLVAKVVGGSRGMMLSCGLFAETRDENRIFDPFITLDFGRFYHAFPCLEFDAPPGAVVEIACGVDMLPDGHAALNGKVNWLRNNYSHRYVSAGGRQKWQLFECQPVRFLHVVFRSVPTPIKVFSVKLAAWEYPAEQRGNFSCSDAVLTKLWQAGVDTARAHVTDTVHFDPLRERAPYSMMGGEMEQGMDALAAGFGDDIAFIDWLHKQTNHLQHPGGLFPILMGGLFPIYGFPARTAPVMHCNGTVFPSYQAFIPHAVRNRYWKTGNIVFLQEWYPALVRLAEWFMRKSDDSGLLYNLPGWLWFDWIEDNELRGANFESNAIYYKMLVDLGEIAEQLSLLNDAEKWRKMAVKAQESLRKMHWNEQRGLFADSVIDGRQSEYYTGLSNGMAILYGIADEKQKTKIVKALTEKDALYSRPTILYFYYLIEGLIKGGATDYALRLLSSKNKCMMESENPPTFHEYWPDGTEGCVESGQAVVSKLHMGGTGVVQTLFEHALGVVPTTPGYATCRIEPKCGHLDWAKGTVPTVRGDIHVEWRKDAAGFALEVVLPDNIPTVLAIPCVAEGAVTVTHNGEISTCVAEENCVIVNVDEGAHSVVVK